MKLEGHTLASLSRYSRGCAAISGRPLVGYVVSCECGWSTRVNMPKRKAIPYHADHVREMRANQKGPTS